METNEVLEELQKSIGDGSLQIYRNLIIYASSSRNQSPNILQLFSTQCKLILAKLLRILTENEEIGKEQILLAAHAFLTLLNKHSEREQFKDHLQNYFQLGIEEKLHSFEHNYEVQNMELFKLIIAHGYLQVNDDRIYSPDICKLPFAVFYQNCIQYTRYTYFAYKILQNWLQKTMKNNFWKTNDPIFELKLEAIVYSNWDNSIKEVCKHNATSIFNKYLKIMEIKYNGFLAFAFKNCVRNISWQNETKYVMLAEICDVWDDVTAITEVDFISCLFTSLTKSYLRSAGTRVYNTISNKLDENEWKIVFGYCIECIVAQWETGSEKNYQALQLLCTHWLEPTIEKNRNLLPFLYSLGDKKFTILYHSHLERMASKMGITVPRTSAHEYIDDSEEFIRINSFAIHCQKFGSVFQDDSIDPVPVIKHFLFCNANAHTAFLRGSILTYFKVFVVNLMKVGDTREGYDIQMFDTFDWLHEFLLDCFEIGSCYQRKILGVTLYRAILFYTIKGDANEQYVKDARYREALKYGFRTGEKLKAAGKWTFTDKRSLMSLLRLVLDPANDIREIAASILLDSFEGTSLTDLEKEVLLDVAVAKCNSFKFYEAESGAVLFKVLSHWRTIVNVTVECQRVKEELTSGKSQSVEKVSNSYAGYIQYLLEESENQLICVKHDVLSAATKRSPLFGVLTAILTIGFRRGPECNYVTQQVAGDLLDLLDNAVQFFLCLLSSKSNDSEFSSSFAEMGLAIDETVKDSEIGNEFDDVTVSPAHQIVISCIWTSLKVSCEIASEIGALQYSYGMVQRSANLIISVLTKCRHKGAIEAAGLAIGRLTRALCKITSYSKLPEKWLKDLLTGCHHSNPNVTRRSAGLSIMFHRIVANDNRKDKPLVHMAIQMLLELLGNSNSAENSETRDSPRARNLHFLQTLVADKELNAQIVPHLENITLECFGNLQSKVWAIRNASLQLFGAIVPRLVGQCAGGRSLDFGNGYSIDHFITHYPQLASYVLAQLKHTACPTDQLNIILESHAGVVHILSLLSKMSTGGCDLIDYSSVTYIKEIKRNLRVIFASPIAHVRILAAKTYAAMTALPHINMEFEKLKKGLCKVRSCNLAYGSLCAMQYLKVKLTIEMENANSDYKFPQLSPSKQSQNLNTERDQLIKDGETSYNSLRTSFVFEFWDNLRKGVKGLEPCYVLESIFLKLYTCFEISSEDVFLFNQIGEKEDRVLASESTKPGFSEFIGTLMGFYAGHIKRTGHVDRETIEKILNSQCTHQSVTFLNHLEFHMALLQIVYDHMLNRMQICDRALLDAMIEYLMDSAKHVPYSETRGIHIRNTVNALIKNTEENIRHSRLEQLFHLSVSVFATDVELIDKTVLYIVRMSFDEDEEVKQSAAECLQFIANRLTEMKNKNKLMILKCCLALLKNGTTEVKELVRSSLGPVIAAGDSNTRSVLLNNDIMYYKIFYEVILNKYSKAKFSWEEIIGFFIECVQSVGYSDHSKATLESPFNHGDDASYAEDTKFYNILYHCLSAWDFSNKNFNNMLENNLISIDNTVKLDCMDVIQAMYRIQKISGLDFGDLRTVLQLSYEEYLLSKRKLILKLCHSKNQCS